MDSTNTDGTVTRRGFLGGAAAAAAGAYAFSPGLGSHAAAQQVTKVNSTINGVRLGINAPYSFRGQYASAEETLKAMVQLGLSWVELRGPAIEGYAGMPQAPAAAAGGGGARGGGGGGGGGGGEGPAAGAAGGAAGARPAPAQRTPEQIAAQQATARQRAEEIKRWRLSQSMDKYHDLRRMYEQAGVNIQLVKFPDLTADLSDDEADYIFQVAKALGAEAITTEPPLSHTKRLGQIANKHRIMIGYHGHDQVTEVERFGRPGAFEQAFFYSPYNGANVDIGHWTAGNNTSAEPFIREYAHRITNLHLKDRKKDHGPNVAWGEGDTPLVPILRMMRDMKYTFQATIELEHPVPAGSDVLKEIAKCVEFARRALNS